MLVRQRNQNMDLTKPTRLSSKIVALNDHEFLAMMDSGDFMKYNTINRKWTRLLQLPHRHSFSAMVMNKELNRLYIRTGTGNPDPRYCGCMNVLDVSTGRIIRTYELEADPDEYNNNLEDLALVNANGTIHRIGGDRYHHAIWNEEVGIWNHIENPQCPWDNMSYLCAGPVIYVKSKNVILMFGGTSFDEGGNDGNEGIWRLQVATSKWENVTTAHGASYYCGADDAVLTPDEQNVIIVDSSHIYILDIQNDDEYQITKSIDFSVLDVAHLKLCRHTFGHENTF